MKKRMFLSTILMTLVLLVAVTTATFAWYAAAEGEWEQGSSTHSITTAKNEYKAGDVTFTVVAAQTTGEDAVGPTDHEGKIKVWYGDNLTTETAEKYAKNGTITWSIDVNGATADELAVLAGVYNVKFSATDLRFGADGAAAMAKDVDADNYDGSITLTFEIDAYGNITYSATTFGFAVNYSVEDPNTPLTINAVISE